MRKAPPYFLGDAALRGIRLSLLVTTCLLCTVQLGFSQGKKPVVEDRTLTTDDNFQLKISYYKSMSAKDAPVAVLLHGEHGTRQNWKGLAIDLQTKADFAVITVDLRGHGESPKKDKLKKGDYLAMATLDMEAVRDFIFEENQKGQLNMNKLGIVACDFSASVAMAYTELDWAKPPYDDSPNPEQRTPRGHDVQALALVSPDPSTPGLSANKTANVIRTLGMPVMIAAAEKNAHDLATSKKLFEQIATKREKDETLYFAKYPAQVKGMDLIVQDGDLRSHIVAFLDKYVKQHKSQWQDRRSRLNRE